MEPRPRATTRSRTRTSRGGTAPGSRPGRSSSTASRTSRRCCWTNRSCLGTARPSSLTYFKRKAAPTGLTAHSSSLLNGSAPHNRPWRPPEGLVTWRLEVRRFVHKGRGRRETSLHWLTSASAARVCQSTVRHDVMGMTLKPTNRWTDLSYPPPTPRRFIVRGRGRARPVMWRDDGRPPLPRRRPGW